MEPFGSYATVVPYNPSLDCNYTPTVVATAPYMIPVYTSRTMPNNPYMFPTYTLIMEPNNLYRSPVYTLMKVPIFTPSLVTQHQGPSPLQGWLGADHDAGLMLSSVD